MARASAYEILEGSSCIMNELKDLNIFAGDGFRLFFTHPHKHILALLLLLFLFHKAATSGAQNFSALLVRKKDAERVKSAMRNESIYRVCFHASKH